MITRRHFIGTAAAVAILPSFAGAQVGVPRSRVEWSRFKTGPQLPAFRAAIAAMRANTNAGDPGSWAFWANAHQRFCPHSRSYFLAWHRALLGLFEQQLQRLSGVPDLALPYWDYYATPVIPAEFTGGTAATNPLYHGRDNVDVREALSLDPFAPDILVFQRGAGAAFEPAVEGRPHNRVHSIIAGDMVTLQSPRDPIFWLHHANIDRLWSAWAAAGGGRTMPADGDTYWNGDFTYGPGVTAPKAATRDTASAYGYVYDNQTMPAALPGAAPARPPFRRFDPSFPLLTRPNFFSIGPSTSLELGAQDFTLNIPVATSLRSRMGTFMSDGPGAGDVPGSVRSVSVVLDGVTLSEAGAKGGYFYNVYVNLPATPGAPEARHLIGSVTPFEIAAAQGHAGHDGDAAAPVRLVFPATEKLRELSDGDLNRVAVSFVRVEGENSPAGVLIRVRDFRVEASAGAAE